MKVAAVRSALESLGRLPYSVPLLLRKSFFVLPLANSSKSQDRKARTLPRRPGNLNGRIQMVGEVLKENRSSMYPR